MLEVGIRRSAGPSSRRKQARMEGQSVALANLRSRSCPALLAGSGCSARQPYSVDGARAPSPPGVVSTAPNEGLNTVPREDLRTCSVALLPPKIEGDPSLVRSRGLEAVAVVRSPQRIFGPFWWARQRPMHAPMDRAIANHNAAEDATMTRTSPLPRR